MKLQNIQTVEPKSPHPSEASASWKRSCHPRSGPGQALLPFSGHGKENSMFNYYIDIFVLFDSSSTWRAKK